MKTTKLLKYYFCYQQKLNIINYQLSLSYSLQRQSPRHV